MNFSAKDLKEKLKKLFVDRLIEEFPNRIYNLGFGDWDDGKEDVDDRVATNNNDKQKVLATVADTVLDFTNHHPDAFVFAQGSTVARTRLYQMGIASFLGEIDILFTIIAYYDGKWEPFEKGKDYEAFLVKRK